MTQYTIDKEETRFICRQSNLNDCGQGVRYVDYIYVDFTGGVDLLRQDQMTVVRIPSVTKFVWRLHTVHINLLLCLTLTKLELR